MKKILIVGSQKVWATENIFIDELGKDHQVDCFPAHGIFLDYYHKNILNKLSYRLGLSRILNKINCQLISLQEKEHYELIWIFKGMEIFPETIKRLKASGARLINYNGDHPFVHDFRGSGNQNVLESIELYDHHFTYSKNILNDFKNKTKVSCSWLPFGYFSAHEPSIQEDKKALCFIGNPDEERVRMINFLASNQVPIDVYGNDWQNHLEASERITINPPVYKEDFVKTAQSYRVQLNIFRPHNCNSHNMRTFEMPALGTIMLAPYSYEHADLFENEKEVFLYKNDEECLNLAKKILTMNFDQAYAIKKAAYQRSLDSHYSYAHRAQEVLKMVEAL